MTPDQYKKIIDSCKTREELLRLKENTLKKKRPDLAEIADQLLLERFPPQNKWTTSSGKSSKTIPYDQAKEYYKSHPSLDRDQIEFLAKHGVPEQNVFNATGLSTASYKQKMGVGDYDIAYGTVACEKGGHSLRTSSGHCIQCDPIKLSFLLRHRREGEVYVAESNANSRIIKVGCGKSSIERVSGLNSEKYAGRNDWIMKGYYGVKNMGLVESEVHATLSKFSISDRYYLKDGQKTACREIFSCSADDAINALKKIIAMHT